MLQRVEYKRQPNKPYTIVAPHANNKMNVVLTLLIIYCCTLGLAQNITTIEWNVLNRFFTATGKTRRDCFPLKDLFCVFFGDRFS
jgi:hypothetical protein